MFYMSKLYNFNDYDKYLCLKLSSELWLVVAYLMRPYIAIISTIRLGPGARKGVEGVDTIKLMLYPDDFSMTLGILSTFPVLFFVYIYMKKKPDAAPYVRMWWSRSAWLLGTSAILNVIIVFVPLLTGAVSHIQMPGWIQIGIALLILGYLFGSQRVKDTFADFPREENVAD